MSRNPFFVSLALASWLCVMLASALVPALPGAVPVLLCGAALTCAALLRSRGRGLAPAARLLLGAATLLPPALFLLASTFMGPVSSTMMYGLTGMLIAQPLDACLSKKPVSPRAGQDDAL